MTIQLDYGGFNSDFLGITLKFDKIQLWKIFDDFRKSEKLPKVDKLTPDEPFETLSITSTLSHEVRHFHDFLLSPYSIQIFSNRVQLLINTLQILVFLFDNTANCVPIPITKWCKLNKSQREREFLYLPDRQDKLPWKPIHFPFIGNLNDVSMEPCDIEVGKYGEDYALEKLIKASSVLRSRIKQLTFNPDMVRGAISFQPWQIYELSGLIIQMQDIWVTYGEKHTQSFIDYLLAKYPNSPYSLMVSIIAEMWKDAGQPFDTRLTSAMITWCLLGSYEKDGWKACPTMRFVYLWNHIRENGMKKSSDLLQTFNEWSNIFNVSTTADAITETQVRLNKLAILINDNLSNFPNIPIIKTYAPLLKRVVKNIAFSNDIMIKRLNENPEHYINPNEYLRNANNFVLPVLRIMFDNEKPCINKTTKESLENKGYLIDYLKETDDNFFLTSIIEPPSHKKLSFLDIRDVELFTNLIRLTDFIFSENNRTNSEMQRTGQYYFKLLKKTPIEIQFS